MWISMTTSGTAIDRRPYPYVSILDDDAARRARGDGGGRQRRRGRARCRVRVRACRARFVEEGDDGL